MSGGPAARPRSCATRGSSIGRLNASTSLVTSHGQRHCAHDKGVGVIRAWASSRRGWDAWHGPHRLVGAHDQRFFEVGAGKRDRGTAARAVRRYDHCGHARRARPHRAPGGRNSRCWPDFSRECVATFAAKKKTSKPTRHTTHNLMYTLYRTFILQRQTYWSPLHASSRLLTVLRPLGCWARTSAGAA